MKKVFANTRKPQGFIGKMMAKGMNGGDHKRLANWGFSHVTFRGDEQAADLGCGGGANVMRLLQKIPNGTVKGLDYSEVSVAISRETNEAEIAKGRCEILQGNVMDLPFADESFDVVTAFETIYFWPDLNKSFSEVFRTLKSGGFFMITNESDGKNEKSLKWLDMIDGMRIYTADDLQKVLADAGFTDIEIYDEVEKDRLCVVAQKA